MKTKHSITNCTLGKCVLILALSLISTTFAATAVSKSDGDWMNDKTWGRKIAGADDDVRIGNHSVFLKKGVFDLKLLWAGIGTGSVSKLSIGGDAAGATATINVTRTGANSADIGRSQGSKATMELFQGGTFRTAGTANIGFATDSSGEIKVAGGEFYAANLNIGQNGAGKGGAGLVNIVDGRVLVSGITIVGNHSLGTGELNVSGGNFSTGALLVGVNSKGSVAVSGATLNITGPRGLRIANENSGNSILSLTKGGHISITHKNSTSYLGANTGSSTLFLTMDAASSITTRGELIWRRGYAINFVTGSDESFSGITARALLIKGSSKKTPPKIIVDLAAFTTKFEGTRDIVLLTLESKSSELEEISGEYKNANKGLFNLTDIPPKFAWKKSGKQWQFVLTLTSTQKY